MFLDKIYLSLLFLLPVLAFLFYVFYKKRKKALSLLISRVNTAQLSNVNLKAYCVKYVFMILGLAFLILALARPQYGDKTQEVIKESSEIVFALDISKSMLAQDNKPDRLEKAKLMLLQVIEESAGEKIGIIVFSGTAMWQCPMTYDFQALKMFLQGIGSAQLPLGGTQISDAVDLAVKAVSANPSSSKVMVLISDGEDHDSKLKEALSNAKSAGLKIFTAAIGTPQGAPIPLTNQSNEITGYVKDRSGNIVMSKMNPVLLKNMADETGGSYFDASEKDVSRDIVRVIKEAEKNKSESQRHGTKADRFQIFLFFAAIAFFIELLIPIAKR
ncbi:MAG: VWA domain-containing protein [Endomicrobium sp.]|jgi:Ca-activated chloride channel family protein|nr:VWA domain-containing protein [Endomicrobium sp.]